MPDIKMEHNGNSAEKLIQDLIKFNKCQRTWEGIKNINLFISFFKMNFDSLELQRDVNSLFFPHQYFFDIADVY